MCARTGMLMVLLSAIAEVAVSTVVLDVEVVVLAPAAATRTGTSSAGSVEQYYK